LIVIPNTAKQTEKIKKGVIIAVGAGEKDNPMQVSVGERIVYKKADYPISEGCEIIHQDDVLYVI
jgi:co-chaperonin GroES (HSP10)